MFHFKLYEDRALYGMTYTFPKRGDGIGMHDHTEAQKHNVIVLRGRVELYGPDRCWSVTLNAGDIFILEDNHHPHEVAALEDNTAVLGMFVHGRPAGEYLPEEDKTGTITNRPLTLPLKD